MQQNILSGLNFEPDKTGNINYQKLAKFKSSQLIVQLQRMAQLISDERRVVKLIVLYIANYKIKTDKDFRLLCSLFDQSVFPAGVAILKNALQIHQSDAFGKVFSDSVDCDKFDRITEYMTIE